MDSRDHHSGHLDATTDREVVYCHACSNEWYRDEHGLTCPDCESDITEIVSPENDPRDMGTESSGSASPDFPPLLFADDSDPEEADIEEHMGPHGFQFRRSTRAGPDQRHHDPTVDPVLERFYDMIQHFGQPRRYESGVLFGRPGNENVGGPRIQRTTFTSGTFGNGTTHVTIFSGPANIGAHSGGSPAGAGEVDPFQSIFSNVIRDMGPPEAEGDAGPRAGFARGLQDILNLFNPANATIGDAVYSQEALDRIITQLMEANPQSNAAPPATEEALKKLDRKKVDQEMLGPEGNAECSICIDEMKEGETAVFLPCKHWFHEECVVLWLKEHNTCPVCRTPVEKNERDGANPNAQGRPPNGSQPSRGDSAQPDSPWANFGGARLNRDPGLSESHSGADTPTGRAAADMVSSVHLDQQSRPPNQSQSRLNEALRSVANMQRERDRDRRDRATASGFSYDTSRLQRRTSHSPTSPRATNAAEHGARMRQRSPSESSRRSAGERDTRRQSGGGPLSWLRDRFTGGGSSNNQGSSRDEQQP